MENIMKIVSITVINNEADIIESFIRYHLNIVDEMIILNDGSTDDTNNILDKLSSEGLPLIVLNDNDSYSEPMKKYNCLLKKAVSDYNADIICPLDVDEFITCSNGNPRKIIEKISPFTFYKIKWKTYVPHKNDDLENKFVPSRITHIRDEKIETLYKVILTGDLSDKYDVKLNNGNHNLKFKKQFENKIHGKECDELKIAHFPSRSIEQMISKVLLSYPNALSRENFNPNINHNYQLMFNKILESESIDIEDVAEFAKQYSLEENKGKQRDIDIIHDPMNLSFCKDISIKYDFKVNTSNNVLNNYMYFAKEINKLKNDIEKSKSNYLSKIDEIANEKNEVQNNYKRYVIKMGDKDKEIRFLKNEIEDLKRNYYENLETEQNKLKVNLDYPTSENSKIDNLELRETQLEDLESTLVNRDVEIKELNNKLQNANSEIISLKDTISVKERNFKNKEVELNNQIGSLKSDISEKENIESELNTQIKDTQNQLDNQNYKIKIKEQELLETEQSLDSIKRQYVNQLSKLDTKEYCISCYKEEIANNHLEINYLKNNSLFRKLSNYFAYIYLIFKSNPHELSLNFKLYKALKDSKCFDIGFYLNNNNDIQESKWCKYFSPELHYVCNGFDEKRKFNKKFFNTHSKKELLDYILNCNY